MKFSSTEHKKNHDFQSMFKTCHNFYFMMVEISITQNVQYHEYLTMLPKRKDISLEILTKYYST